MNAPPVQPGVPTAPEANATSSSRFKLLPTLLTKIGVCPADHSDAMLAKIVAIEPLALAASLAAADQPAELFESVGWPAEEAAAQPQPHQQWQHVAHVQDNEGREAAPWATETRHENLTRQTTEARHCWSLKALATLDRNSHMLGRTSLHPRSPLAPSEC